MELLAPIAVPSRWRHYVPARMKYRRSARTVSLSLKRQTIERSSAAIAGRTILDSSNKLEERLEVPILPHTSPTLRKSIGVYVQ